MPLALEAMQTEHEADRTTYIMINRALDQSCILTGDILQRLTNVFEGLRLFPDRMRQNLDLTSGLIMSEAIVWNPGTRPAARRPMMRSMTPPRQLLWRGGHFLKHLPNRAR